MQHGRATIPYDDGFVTAYAMTRMTPISAVVERILTEVEKRLPNFRPSSILDFGSGPGTCIWPLREIWGDSISEITAVEPNESMRSMAQHLLDEDEAQDVRWCNRLPAVEVTLDIPSP